MRLNKRKVIPFGKWQVCHMGQNGRFYTEEYLDEWRARTRAADLKELLFPEYACTVQVIFCGE
jgi:hypothetical protein